MNKPITDTSTRKSGRVRYPKTLFVDGMELEPAAGFFVITRDSVIVELSETRAKEIYEYLGKRLEGPVFASCRIKFIGREVS